MYDDSWYSFVPEITGKQAATKSPIQAHHKRKESLLQQPNGTDAGNPFQLALDDIQDANGPPEATVVRRAASFTDFHHRSRPRQTKAPRRDPGLKQSGRKKLQDRSWDALMIAYGEEVEEAREPPRLPDRSAQLLRESRREYLLYRDQLAVTENHLDSLIRDANESLALLMSLSASFKSVEVQTTSFKEQCDDLLSEQTRLEKLANKVRTNLQYYEYLDNVSRRLNAPGAGRLVEYDDFREVLDHLEACIAFMSKHPSYRDAESYLARYQALLTKALHLLEVGFSNKLESVSQELSRQLAATRSESAKHALAYGRFEEMMLDSYSLIPNIQKVMSNVYDEDGYARPAGVATDIFTNTAKNLFHAYLSTRDRDLRPVIQHDMEEFKKGSKSAAMETACRNYTKQCFERAYNEANLFSKMFNIDPQPSPEPESAHNALKSGQRWLVTPANLKPLATGLQSVLQSATLEAICNFVAWLTNEYLLLEYDEEESPYVTQCRRYTATLLSDYLWAFTDNAFDVETTASITKAVVSVDSLKISPVVNGLAASNAHLITKRALELLAMFDQCMPKERSQQNSPVVFKIVRETIQVLQRAEARLKSTKMDTDPDLFMIKNLLILKNELVSLEIGDIRSQAASMQHFSQIWDTMSPGNWMGFFGGLIGGVSGSLWSRGDPQPSVTAKTLTVDDMSEQLDELLRQNIYAFTKRWAAQINDATSGKAGAKPMARIEKELGEGLAVAFGGQPEVVGKLREAIQINARALKEADGQKKGIRRY